MELSQQAKNNAYINGIRGRNKLANDALSRIDERNAMITEIDLTRPYSDTLLTVIKEENQIDFNLIEKIID